MRQDRHIVATVKHLNRIQPRQLRQQSRPMTTFRSLHPPARPRNQQLRPLVEVVHLMLIAAPPSWKPFVSATNSVKLNLPPSKSFGIPDMSIAAARQRRISLIGVF